MALIPPFVGAIVYTAVEFVVFLFVIIATPTAQFYVNNSASCFTFFGLFNSCGGTHPDLTGKAAFGCAQRRDNMSAGAAFAIISILTTLAALICGVMMLARVACAVVLPLVFICLSVVFILISWACVAGVYNNNMCGGSAYYHVTHYGPGFGLMVTAWCLQVLNLVVLVLLSFF